MFMVGEGAQQLFTADDDGFAFTVECDEDQKPEKLWDHSVLKD